MSWVFITTWAFNTLLFLRGFLRLAISGYMAWTAKETWTNPHPVGKQITPELFAAFALFFLVNGYTHMVTFFAGTITIADFHNNSDFWHFVLGMVLEDVTLVYSWHRVRRVTKVLTGPLR